jgi:thiol-disulfide isomerase/thioredoxin
MWRGLPVLTRLFAGAFLMACGSAGMGGTGASGLGGSATLRAANHAANVPTFAPKAALGTLDHGSTTLSAVLGGRPALLSLWAPWCEPCVEELPSLDRADRDARALGGVVVGIAVGEPPDKIAEFVGRRGVRLPQLVDENFAFADALGRSRVPTTVVLDAEERVVFVGGRLDAAALAAFRALLVHPAQSPVAAGGYANTSAR